MEMNEIDNILGNLDNEIPREEHSLLDYSENQPLSDIDISNILEENGFTESSDEEENEESYNENQGESTNFNAERSLEETRENFNEALDEAVETIGENQTESIDTDENISESTEEVPKEAKIPLNSPTLLVDESTTRFSGAEWFSEIQKQRIIIAGIGGIGSNAAFQIARMIPANITIYDDDNVEMVNMAGQLYSYNDIGKSKVDAIASMISSYTTMKQINAIKGKFTLSTEPGDIMMCGFDNMSARKIFFHSWKEHILKKTQKERAKCLYLDGRLSMDTLQILCIKGDDLYNIEKYKDEYLFNDNEAETTICSMKQTTYLACMIGSLMTNLFTNFVANLLTK